MAWRWLEPGKRGRKGALFATRDEAVKNAVHTALRARGAQHRDIPPDQVPVLWRSMKAAGWSAFEEKQP